MKNKVIPIIIGALIASTSIAVNAESYKTTKIIVNGSEINENGIIKDNRTLVPVRGIFEELGYDVEWSLGTKTAFFAGDDFNVEIQNGENYFMCLNTKTNKSFKVTPDVPQQIIDGHFYVPLRAFSEAIGAEVKWNAISYTVEIETDYTVETETEESSDYKTDYTAETETENSFYKKNPNAEIDFNDFKSDCIKEFLKSENIKYDEERYDVFKMELQADNFSEDTIDDLKQFPNVESVYFKGNAFTDLSALESFFKEFPNSDVFNLEMVVFEDNSLEDASVLVEFIPGDSKIEEIIFEDNTLKEPMVIADFFKAHKDSEIKFRLPDEKWLNKSTIEEYIDYDKIKKEIIGKVINKKQSEFGKVLAIHDYMVLNTEYDYSNYKNKKTPKEDYNPYYVLKNGKGVCSGYTKATKDLLDMIGIESEIVHGTAYNSSGWGSHAWLIVKVEGNYYHLDVTWDDPVGVPSDYIQWKYFLKSDSVMEERHKWDKSEYKECPVSYEFTPPYDYFEIHPDYLLDF